MPIMHSLYRESGRVRIDPGTCTQCGACARICPSEVLVADDGKVRVRSDSPLGCIACGHCMMVCPDGAITVTGRGISPEDLSPLPDPDSKAGADELAALMRSRRSVRRFSDQEVDASLLERIVELAATAPMGIPPWDVGCVAVRGREEVQRIAAEVIKGYEGFLRIFKPWVFAVMRPFVGQAKYDMFAHFVRPLAEMYVRGRREGRALCRCRRCGHRVHLCHVGGRVYGTGQYDHRRRSAHSPTQQGAMSKTWYATGQYAVNITDLGASGGALSTHHPTSICTCRYRRL